MISHNILRIGYNYNDDRIGIIIIFSKNIKKKKLTKKTCP